MTNALKSLLDLDREITLKLRIAETPGPLKSLLGVINHSGDSWYWAIALLVVILVGTPEWRYRAIVMLISILVMAPLVLLLKHFIRRQRPVGDWGAVYRKTDPHSFPSGHAVRAVMLAVLAVGMGPMWFSICLVIWAPLVGFSRIAMGVHYLSDVLAGLIIGLAAGTLTLLIIL
jgi:undecaprenyl-diphosphatase